MSWFIKCEAVLTPFWFEGCLCLAWHPSYPDSSELLISTVMQLHGAILYCSKSLIILPINIFRYIPYHSCCIGVVNYLFCCERWPLLTIDRWVCTRSCQARSISALCKCITKCYLCLPLHHHSIYWPLVILHCPMH